MMSKTDSFCKVEQLFGLPAVYEKLLEGRDVVAIHYDDNSAPRIKDLRYEGSFDDIEDLNLSNEWVFITFRRHKDEQ